MKNFPGPFMEGGNSTNEMLSDLCKIETVESLVCSSAMFLICGFNSRQLNGTRVQVYVAHATAGTSNQNMYHYTQSYEHGGFRKFDYGQAMNLKKYGTPFAPEYNLRKINSTDIALLYGANDWLADLKDVNFIRNQIGKDKLKMDYEVPLLSWNHLDFLYGLNAAEYVNVKVIELLSQYRNFP
ncbi:gastric triacylglycerol lipase-like protein [Leptotrombidium deliense]|uniref:Gastric triacylglycerol lipase-like protein n=1 Tax=Leptotrombidium deliense TaxID=299467 RepID=A0A443RV89_9ACAR|nr:gastric triacylglycerol lipase-like protein [Leptotrombidium deliense]